MSGECKPPHRTTISHAETLDEIAEYWDTHSLADHWDQTREVEFKVRAQRRRRLDPQPPTRETTPCT
jgi:hypothetical protein